MKIAVIGSGTLRVDLESYNPPECPTIVIGGAGGMGTCEAEFARAKGLALGELLPDYKKDGRGAPMPRNLKIICWRTACWRSGMENRTARNTPSATASRLGGST